MVKGGAHVSERLVRKLNVLYDIVEPFEFLPEYSAVWCFDLNDKVCKQFKISRMEEAENLDSCLGKIFHYQSPFSRLKRIQLISKKHFK